MADRLLRWLGVVIVGVLAVTMVVPFVHMVSTSLMDEFEALRFPPALVPRDPRPGNYAAALPLIVIMVVAFASTKWPILLERGVWAAAHESRTDWSMLLGSVYLLINGAGPWSLDGRLARGRGRGPR